jgi:hypothetical protein
MPRGKEKLLPLWRCPKCAAEQRCLGNAVGHPCPKNGNYKFTSFKRAEEGSTPAPPEVPRVAIHEDPTAKTTLLPAPAEIRSWAALQGIPCNAKGKVPQDIVRAYLTSHQG